MLRTVPHCICPPTLTFFCFRGNYTGWMEILTVKIHFAGLFALFWAKSNSLHCPAGSGHRTDYCKSIRFSFNQSTRKIHRQAHYWMHHLSRTMRKCALTKAKSLRDNIIKLSECFYDIGKYGIIAKAQTTICTALWLPKNAWVKCHFHHICTR